MLLILLLFVQGGPHSPWSFDFHKISVGFETAWTLSWFSCSLLQESILQWQRKCEDALHSLLVLGARRPVRRLASMAMGKVIAKGDGISIYSRASSLQGWLADGKRSEPHSCAGKYCNCQCKFFLFFPRSLAYLMSSFHHVICTGYTLYGSSREFSFEVMKPSFLVIIFG